MNPMIAEQIRIINRTLEKIAEQLAATREHVETLHTDKEDLQKKVWGHAKGSALFKDAVDELAACKDRLRDLEAQNADFEKRLRTVLQCTRSLASEFMP